MPDFLVVGHIVKDIEPGGWRPGGAVYYASAQARRLGLRVGTVTACGDDVSPATVLPDVDWQVVYDDQTTSFENRDVDGHREQRVLALGRPLTLDDIPAGWRSAPLILLAPVIQDVDSALGAQMTGQRRLVGLAAQGWLRRLDADGRVSLVDAADAPAWLQGDVVFVSTEDIADESIIEAWRAHVRVVVLTRGALGCSVWDARGRHDIAAHESTAVDTTGAGDVFAAAFLIRYHEAGDAVLAARFAAAAAALCVRGVGIDAIGGRKAIDTLLATAPVSAR